MDEGDDSKKKRGERKKEGRGTLSLVLRVQILLHCSKQKILNECDSLRLHP